MDENFQWLEKKQEQSESLLSENLLLAIEANARDHSIRNTSNISTILSLYIIYYLKITISNN